MSFLLLSGCGFVHDEHITGPYRLIAVDINEQMSISYDLGDGNAIGRIGETVFAYGFDKRFIVAKQHPNNDRSITNYFFLDMTKDSVTGPLSKKEFQEVSKNLGFTHTLNALKKK